MKRNEILSSPEYWITKIQVALYNCARNFMKKENKIKVQLAEHLGVTKSYVSQLFNGNYDHRISKFVELSLAFGYIPEIRFKPIEQAIREDKIDYAKLGQSLLAQRSCMSSTTKGEDATNRIIIESGDLKPENAA